MSWSKRIFQSIYKRAKKINLTEEKSKSNFEGNKIRDFEWLQEVNHAWSTIGTPQNMEELAILRLLTLLRKLSIKSADKYLDQTGWHS
jgi:hypothetical protein